MNLYFDIIIKAVVGVFSLQPLCFITYNYVLFMHNVRKFVCICIILCKNMHVVL